MSAALRSKQGCWTCRLRKKKCDERRDICSTCESLTITCYGYGNKPDWMDNGEKERAMAHSIKQIVKHTSRRKATGRLGILKAKFQKHDNIELDPSQMIEPASAPRILQKAGNEDLKSKSPAASITQSQDSATTLFLPEAQSTPQSAPSDTSHRISTEMKEHDTAMLSVPLSMVSGDEPILLMHYLDIVFFLQYPMYKSSVVDGGRGWVLSLLLRIKPLYHAALALSAYHRGAMLLASQRDESRYPINLNEQEEHLAKFFDEFRASTTRVGHFVEQRRPGDCMTVLSCIVQLVFFELFANRGNTWQVPLKMAADMITDAYKEPALHGVINHVMSADEIPSTSHEAPKGHDIITFPFFSGVIMWLDIISSVTSGTAPRMLPLDSDEVPIRFQGQAKLENIVGCSDWALLQIGRISRLYEFQTESCQHDGSGCSANNLSTYVDRIREDLVQGIAKSHMISLSLSDDPTTFALDGRSNEITRLFALTGLAYLHSVILGINEGPSCVEPTTVEAMALLRRAASANYTTAVVFPLYIFACIANEEDKPFFRHVFSSAPLLDPTLDHRRKMLLQLEQVWTLRHNADAVGVTWSEVLQVSDGTLLI